MISKAPTRLGVAHGARAPASARRRLHADAAAAAAAGTGQPILRNVIAAYGDGMFAS